MEKEKLMILFTNKQVFHLSCQFFYLILMSPVIFQSSPFRFFFPKSRNGDLTQAVSFLNR